MKSRQDTPKAPDVGGDDNARQEADRAQQALANQREGYRSAPQTHAAGNAASRGSPPPLERTQGGGSGPRVGPGASDGEREDTAPAGGNNRYDTGGADRSRPTSRNQR